MIPRHRLHRPTVQILFLGLPFALAATAAGAPTPTHMQLPLIRKSRKRSRNVTMPPILRQRSNSNSESRKTAKNNSRMLMRPWLEQLLDANSCRGLAWSNKRTKTFTINWRHASSHGFDQSEHGDVFYQWACHTGKLKAQKGEHTGNKANFRCALHSLKDCIELTNPGEKKGESAKRTFQFIDPGHPKYGGNRSKAKKPKHSDHVDEAEEAARSILTIPPDCQTDTSQISQVADQHEKESGVKALFSGELLHPVVCSTSLDHNRETRLSSYSSGMSSSTPIFTSHSQSVMEGFSTSTSPLHQASKSKSDSSVQTPSELPNFDKFLDEPRKRDMDEIKPSVPQSDKRSIKLIRQSNFITGIELVTNQSSCSPSDVQSGAFDFPSNLPDFKVLEDPSYNCTNQKLNSGGVVVVKTPKLEQFPLPEINIQTLFPSESLTKHHEQEKQSSSAQDLLREQLMQHQKATQCKTQQNPQNQQQVENSLTLQDVTVSELEIGGNEIVADSIEQCWDGEVSGTYDLFTPEEMTNSSYVPQTPQGVGTEENTTSHFMEAHNNLMSGDIMLATLVEPSRQEETDIPFSMMQDVFSLDSC